MARKTTIRAANPPASLEVLFSECAPVFQDRVRKLAVTYGKTWEQIYTWWREYTASCRSFDQSPIWGEFIVWYEKSLGAAVA